MAVYTVLEHSEIARLIEPYSLGRLIHVSGVTDGIENTNYFLTVAGKPRNGTAHRRAREMLLLTIFEHLTAGDLQFYLDWLEQLRAHGLPVAPPLHDYHGRRIHTVANKPAALFPKLPGHHPVAIAPAHCRAIGEALGKLHAAAITIDDEHEGPRSQTWLEALWDSVQVAMSTEDRGLLMTALQATGQVRRDSNLPAGLIHGDLFPDNTLFEGEKLTGMIDFFSGGNGLLCFDLAVCVNAWCALDDGSLAPARQEALMNAYTKQRPLQQNEVQQWPAVLVLAALRFWISRLAASFEPDITPDGAYTKRKDPAEYRTILKRHLERLGR